MKKVYLLICGFFAAFLTAPSFMNGATKNRIIGAFDSMDSDNEYDDTYDDGSGYDDSDNVTGKKRPAKRGLVIAGGGGSNWMPSNGYFTINIVNSIVGAQTIELFNSLRSFASVTNSVLTAYNPFTFTNRDVANANSTVVYAPNGDLVVTGAAGTALTISCPDIPYRVLVETLKFYRISVKSLKIGFTNTPQLSNVLTFTEQTFLGRNNQNSLMPKAFFNDNQFQSKQVTITNGFIIDGERGINFLVNNGETMDLTFMLNAVAKA